MKLSLDAPEFLCVSASQIGEVDGSTANLTGAQDLQLTLACHPQSQATGTNIGFDRYYCLKIRLFLLVETTFRFYAPFRALADCRLNVCMAGAPMLSRLLEAGPTQFSTPLGFMVGADSNSGVSVSAATPVPVDSAVSATTGWFTFQLFNPKTKRRR